MRLDGNSLLNNPTIGKRRLMWYLSLITLSLQLGCLIWATQHPIIATCRRLIIGDGLLMAGSYVILIPFIDASPRSAVITILALVCATRFALLAPIWSRKVTVFGFLHVVMIYMILDIEELILTPYSEKFNIDSLITLLVTFLFILWYWSEIR
jgi:hypothetical protein